MAFHGLQLKPEAYNVPQLHTLAHHCTPLTEMYYNCTPLHTIAHRCTSCTAIAHRCIRLPEMYRHCIPLHRFRHFPRVLFGCWFGLVQLRVLKMGLFAKKRRRELEGVCEARSSSLDVRPLRYKT